MTIPDDVTEEEIEAYRAGLAAAFAVHWLGIGTPEPDSATCSGHTDPGSCDCDG